LEVIVGFLITMPDQRRTIDPNPATAAMARGSTVALTAILGLAPASVPGLTPSM
jgi:hypothetical protein